MPAPGLLLALLLQAATARPSAAAISGRVIDQGSGRPLPRMVVSLFKEDAAQPVEMTTDAEGRFAFTNLAAGKYGVLVAHDEHRSTYLRQWFGDPGPPERFGGPPRLSLELAPAEQRGGVDIALTRALAIEGHVVDAWGEPIETAEVNATIVRVDGRALSSASTFTDDLGIYRLFGLRPGLYHVCVTPAAQSAAPEGSSLERTCYPASSGENQDGREIAVASGDVTGIDIQLQPTGSRSISGVVMDVRGAPVEGADVAAVPLDLALSSREGSTQDGAFTLKGLAPGRYLLRAAIGVPRPGQVDPPSREPEIGYASVDVGAVDAADLVISLSNTATIRGAVVFDGASAPRAAPSRMVVYASPAERGTWLLGRAPMAPVADDRSFELTGVSSLPALLTVQFLPEGFALKSVRYGERDITDTPTDLTSVAPNGRLDVVITSRVARPSVRVTNEQGEPRRDYRVAMVQADPWRAVRGPALVTGEPSRDGVLPLGTLLPGDYFVAAISVEDWIALSRATVPPEAIASIGTKVTLGIDDRRVLDLKMARLPGRR
jgi:hypothetical protein